MAYDITELHQRIDKCKLILMDPDSGTTFFSALLANLKIKIEPGLGTAATDGVTMWLDPDFIHPQSVKEIIVILLHELGHVIYEHVIIGKAHKLDLYIHNLAGDYYINRWLQLLGYIIPDNWYCDAKYDGWSSMKIYNELMKNKPPPPKSGFMADIRPMPGNMSEQEHRETVTSNIVKAVISAQAAKDYGSIPGDVLRRLDDVLNPKLPWYVILQNYMTDLCKDEYTWRRPNKRFQPDHYLPTLHSEGIKQITAGSDVSASITQENLNEVGSEWRYMWEVLKPERFRLMTFDTKVHLNKVYTEGDQMDNLELKGGGGTNVQPLLDSIQEECPEVAIIFTDGYFQIPDMSRITSDIIWIIKGNPKFTAPKGVVIHYE